MMEPSSQQLYVTFHDLAPARDPKQRPLVNVHIIDEHDYVHENVLADPAPFVLDELRALAWAPDQHLWVVCGAGNNKAGGSTGAILRYERTLSGNPPKHQWVDGVCASWCPTLSHPFDLAFTPAPPKSPFQWWVSNQNTNVVIGPLDGSTFPPRVPPPARHLQRMKGNFCPGTFVASAVKAKDGCGVGDLTLVPSSLGGLEGEFSTESRHSVRGLARSAGTLLYVADEAGNKVRAYSPDGTPGWVYPFRSPVHLMLHGDVLLVGCSGYETHDASEPKGTIFALKLDSAGKPAGDPKPVAEGIAQLSGLAMDKTGVLYCASRGSQQVYQVQPSGKLKAYGPHFGDKYPPEFITCPAA